MACLWLCVTQCTHISQAINHFVQCCNSYCGALTFHLKLSSRSVVVYNRVGRGGGQCSSALCTGSRKIGPQTIAVTAGISLQAQVWRAPYMRWGMRKTTAVHWRQRGDGLLSLVNIKSAHPPWPFDTLVTGMLQCAALCCFTTFVVCETQSRQHAVQWLQFPVFTLHIVQHVQCDW